MALLSLRIAWFQHTKTEAIQGLRGVDVSMRLSFYLETRPATVAAEREPKLNLDIRSGFWNKTRPAPKSPAAGVLPPGRAPSCRYTLGGTLLLHLI